MNVGHWPSRRTVSIGVQLLGAWWLCLAAMSAAFAQNTGGIWLVGQSRADGSIASDSDVSLADQSSIEAIYTLRLLGVGAAQVASAESYVLGRSYRGTEQLAGLIAVSVVRGAPTQLLTSELLSRQNADGGYGELVGYQSTSLDTARALSALVHAGQLATSQNQAALSYLITQQTSSGGWAIGANEPSAYVTARVLDAVWQFRQRFPSAVSSAARAKAFLLSQRQSDALWQSDFESALALIALAPLQSTQGELDESVAALTSKQRSDGSWNGDVYTTALALRAVTLASAPNANPDLARVQGTIVDGDSLVAMAGVSVRLTGSSGATRVTDAQGRFNVADLVAGTYSLAVEASGYPVLSAPLSLTAGQTLDLGVIRLLRVAAPAAARIEGHVTDSSGADLSGASIEVSSGQQAQTDQRGRYLINDVPPGNVTITASKPGYFSARGTTVLLAGATVNFSPMLRSVETTGFSVVGTFTDSTTSQPLAGVQVRIDGSATASAVSDAAGKISLANLTPGEITVGISLNGYESRSAIVTANGGQTLSVSAALTPIAAGAPATFTLRGRVTDAATGAAISGAAITVTGPTGAASTDAAGDYSLPGLTPGSFTITVSAAGYQPASATAVAQAFQNIDFSPGLTAVGVQATAIQATIVDGVSGQPIEGATVVVANATTNVTTMSAPNGGVLVRDVAPLETLVSIEANGYQPRALTFTPTSGFINELGQLALLPEAHSEPVVLTGRIVDSTTNAVLAGVTVVATTPLGSQVAQSDGNGIFRLSVLTGQVADLSFSATSYVAATFTVFVAPESADLGQVRLRPEGLDALLPDVMIEGVDASQVASNAQTYERSGSASVYLQNLGYLAVPAGTDLVAFDDRNRNGALDADETQLGRTVLDAELAAGARRSATMQIAGTMQFRDAPITVLADAARAVIERSESNNSASSIGSCVAIPPAASALNPVLKWRWAGSPQSPSDNNVFGPVLVGQMSDDNGDGVIDSHDVPDLVFTTRGQALTVVSGDDGHTLWQSAANTVTGLGSPALGDIDGDGLNEIVVSNGPRTRLLAFEHNGAVKWNVPNSPTHADTTRDGISIADLNADGVPEIITGRRVYSNTGALLWQGTGDHGGLISYGTLPIAADINRDGTLEVIAGRTAYSATGTVLWNQTTAVGDGFNAIGNFDADTFPEIVLVTTGRVYLFEHTGAIKWGPVTLSGANSRGGAPTVGDFDGDGQVEIGIAGASFYTVLETDGSLKWRKAIVDGSSAFTGSSLFDFDGDGRIEVVYADEQNLFIWDGATGNELFRLPNQSGTTLEYPVVGDVDGDGRAELIVAANEGSLPGVRVFEGGQGEWMPTRAIWNQSTYHIDNINDDGSIPAVEAAGWLTHNSYRANAAVPRQAEPVADLTTGALALIDRGIGQPSALRVRIGNAGVALDAGLATVAFYDGSPTSGGLLLGTVAVPALGAGAFVDLELDGITRVSAGGTLFAVADSTRRITECNEGNNTASTPGRPALGALSVTTDASAYATGDTVTVQGVVTNTGLFTNSYRVEWIIRDEAGNDVAALAAANVPAIASGATFALSVPFNSAGLLAAHYSVHATLSTADGVGLAAATAGFDIRHDPSQGPAAAVRLSTDRPTYHTTDVISIDALSRNLTTSTLINSAQLRLTVADPQGASVFGQTFALGDLVPGALRDLQHSLSLVGAAEGAYGVNATLLDAQGRSLSSAAISFTVVNDPVRAVAGSIAVGSDSVEIGQPLLCTRTTINRGLTPLSTLGLRYLVVRLGDASIVSEQQLSVELAAGANRVDMSTISTAGFSTGDYACTLQASLGGGWRDLAYGTFRVTAPSVQINATLTSEGHGRLLVLMDENGGWPCTPLREIELWTPFRTRLPADARIDVELLDGDGQRVDVESVALRQYRGTVNQRRGSRADLSVVGVSADVLTVKVENGAGLGEGYRIVATVTADSLPPMVVESNVMGSSCGWHAGVGARFGDFHCSGGRTRSGGNLPPPVMSAPTLSQQRAFLEDLLDEHGWSYKIVTDDEAFERELRSGQYTQYALFSEHEKLDEQVQKELREAVYRGEGLLDAGQHDQRHHAFDEALGIAPLGVQSHATAVNLSAPWSPTGTVPLQFGSEALRARLDGAQAIATFVSGRNASTASAGSYEDEYNNTTFGGSHSGHGGGHSDTLAASAYTYGRGKSVYVGYDLLAEATHAGKDSLHAQLLANALTHVAANLTTPHAGEVVPLRLTIQNRATATLGRALLPLPTNVTLIDAGEAQYANGTLSWPLDLAVNEEQRFTVWVRLPEQAGPVTFAARVQSGINPNYIDQAQPTLTLNAIARASLADARALAQTNLRFLLVKLWLDKAQFWLDRNCPEFALASLVQASSEVMKVSHSSAQQLRWHIDDAIWTLSSDLAGEH